MRELNEKLLENVKTKLKQHCFVLDDMKNPLEINGGVRLTAKSRQFEISRSITDLDENIIIEAASSLIVEAFKDVSKISFYSIALQLPDPGTQSGGVLVRGEWFYE